MFACAHTRSARGTRGCGRGAIRGVCPTELLSPPYSAPTVSSRLVRDYNITPVAHTQPELIISSSVRRHDTGVPSPCWSPLICQPLQVFPGHGGVR